MEEKIYCDVFGNRTRQPTACKARVMAVKDHLYADLQNVMWFHTVLLTKKTPKCQYKLESEGCECGRVLIFNKRICIAQAQGR